MAPTHAGQTFFSTKNKKASGYSPKARILIRYRPDYTMAIHGSHTRGAEFLFPLKIKKPRVIHPRLVF